MDYDSYVNCSEIKIFNRTEVVNFLISNPERVVGNVSEDVMKSIHLTISSARTISKVNKNKFGF